MERAKKTLKDYTVDGAIEWEKLIGKTIIYDVIASNGSSSNIQEDKLKDFLRVESLLKSRNVTLLKFKSSWLKAPDVTIYGIIETPVSVPQEEAIDQLKNDEEYKRKILERFPMKKPNPPLPLPSMPWYPWSEPSSPYSPQYPYQKPYAPYCPCDPLNPPYHTWC